MPNSLPPHVLKINLLGYSNDHFKNCFTPTSRRRRSHHKIHRALCLSNSYPYDKDNNSAFEIILLCIHDEWFESARNVKAGILHVFAEAASTTVRLGSVMHHEYLE